MNNFRIITGLDRQKWSDFVYRHPNGNIFQTPEMFEVYKNTKYWQPVFLAAIDNSENILGILLCVIQKEFGKLLGKLTARAIIWGGPLVSSIGPKAEVADCLLKAADEALRRKVIYMQFRNLYDMSENKKYFIDNDYIFEEHLDFICDLTSGEENLWERLFPARRNEIRKAEKNKLQIQLIDNISELKDSYFILKEVYSRIKFPLADKSLFDSAYRILFSKNILKVFLAKDNSRIIGALYLLVYREKVYVWYAGSLLAYLNKHPNDILYWEAIKWGSNNGYQIFDFGGAGSPDKEYGVRDFKRQFGGKLVNYGRFIKIYQPHLMKFINLGRKFLQRL